MGDPRWRGDLKATVNPTRPHLWLPPKDGAEQKTRTFRAQFRTETLVFWYIKKHAWTRSPSRRVGISRRRKELQVSQVVDYRVDQRVRAARSRDRSDQKERLARARRSTAGRRYRE